MLAKSSISPKAPPADAFVPDPPSWYLFCESRRLRQGPLSKRILGQQLVAFRTASGRAVVMEAHCAHLGADLGLGTVVGETIQCPFHNWRYGADGVCTSIPNSSHIPSFACLRTYPVEERHGYLFFFNRSEPLFPLPFFLGAEPRDYEAGTLFSYVADCTWYMNSAHAFDRQHFAAVHDRELLGPPAIDCPAPFARRNSYTAKVVGHTIFDRLLRAGAGRTVNITLTIWGGTFAVITSDFNRVRSGFLIVMEPLEDGRTLCQGIVLAQRAPAWLRPLAPLQLWVRRLFTFGYLKEEARQLRSTRYNPGSLGPNDQDMIDYFNWVATLPRKDDDEDIGRSSDALVRSSRSGVVPGAAAAG
jgi:nitrite reductase/ring-hydroxylating ferredoxin subunit